MASRGGDGGSGSLEIGYIVGDNGHAVDQGGSGDNGIADGTGVRGMKARALECDGGIDR
jgi:hypothetical protein